MSATGRAPWVVSLAAALGVHLGLLALGVVVPARNAFLDVLARGSDGGPQELVVEVDLDREQHAAPTEESRAAAHVDVTPQRESPAPVLPDTLVERTAPSDEDVAPRPMADTSAVVEPSVGDGEPAPTEGPAEPANSWSLAPEGAAGASTGAGAAGWSGLAMTGPGVLAVPGVLGALAPDVASAPAPTEAPRRPDVDRDVAGRVLSETMHHRDQGLGLDQPAARVVEAAVANAVRRTPLPDETTATFEVDVAPGGQVVDARLVKANKGERAAWEQAAAGAKAALSAQGLALRGEAKKQGATIVVRVESRDLYPAGTKKDVDVQPICAEEVITDLIEEHQRDDDAGKPGKAAGGRDRKFCIPVGVAAIADASNLGANMHRVVHTTHEVRIGGKKAMPSQLHPINKDAPWLKFRKKKGDRPVLPPEWRRRKKEWEKKKRRR